MAPLISIGATMPFCFFTATTTTETYTLSLHDALPISSRLARAEGTRARLALHARLTGRRLLLRSEEHTSELQSLRHLVCRLLLEKKKRCRISIRSMSALDHFETGAVIIPVDLQRVPII